MSARSTADTFGILSLSSGYPGLRLRIYGLTLTMNFPEGKQSYKLFSYVFM